MNFTHTSVPRRNRGERAGNVRSLPDTGECIDWLRDHSTVYQAKDVAALTGAGIRAGENIKQGKNGLTMAHLVTWCRNDPEFRAAFFQFCGGTLEGDPEMLAGLTRAVQAYMRQQQRGAE